MPWREQSTLSLRHECVTLAAPPDANIRALCRRYGISPTTGYTLRARFRAEGAEALGLHAPASRYRPSRVPFPDALPPVVCDAGAVVRRVHDGGRVQFQSRTSRVGQAFDGHPVALTPTPTDGVWDVSFAQQCVARIDQRTA